MINLGRDNSKSDLKPERDWRVALISFFLLLAGMAFFHYYLFLSYSQRGSSIEVVDQEKSVGSDSQLLEKVIGNFEAKEKKVREYLDNEFPVFDPAR